MVEQFIPYTELASARPQTLEQITLEKFGHLRTWEDFCEAFNQQYPMPNNYLYHKSLRFNPSYIADGHISCEPAAILFQLWASHTMPNYSGFFLTSKESILVSNSDDYESLREEKFHHVYLGFIEHSHTHPYTTEEDLLATSKQRQLGYSSRLDVRWYHLTLDNGLFKIANEQIPVHKLKQGFGVAFNYLPNFESPDLFPERQIFTDPAILQKYFEKVYAGEDND